MNANSTTAKIKYLALFALAATPVLCAAQSECDSIVSKTDKFTGKTRVSMNNFYSIPVEDGFCLVDIIQYVNEKALRLVIAATEIGCVDDDGAGIFIFQNGNKHTIFNSHEFNCDGIFTVDLRLSKKFATDLYSSPLESFRITGSRRNLEMDVDPEFSSELLSLFQCFSARVSAK